MALESAWRTPQCVEATGTPSPSPAWDGDQSQRYAAKALTWVHCPLKGGRPCIGQPRKCCLQLFLKASAPRIHSNGIMPTFGGELTSSNQERVPLWNFTFFKRVCSEHLRSLSKKWCGKPKRWSYR